MPIFTYTCSCGKRYEELFLGTEKPPKRILCPACGAYPPRDTVYRTTVIGPVWDKLDMYNGALLTPGQRRAGAELKTAKDIERFEQAHGLFRKESHHQRVDMEEMQHDAHQIETIRDNQSREAAIDHVHKTEIQKATGWDDAAFTRHQEMQAKANKAVEDGSLKPDAAATNPHWTGTDVGVTAE